MGSKLPFSDNSVKEDNLPRESWAQEGTTLFNKSSEGEQDDLLLTEKDFDKYDKKAPPCSCEICAPIHFAEGAKAQLSHAEQYIRGLLWAGHPCIGKYGDDGELQCNRFFGKGDPIDFKRDSWHNIVVGIGKHTNQLIIEAKKDERERIAKYLEDNTEVAFGIPYIKHEVLQALKESPHLGSCPD